MKTANHSQQFLRKRKLMMVLPVLVIPFLTIGFWALGGGKSSADNAQQNKQPGLNLQLPNAKLKDDKKLDKFSFYQQAEKDSEKLEKEIKQDPYYTNNDLAFNGNNDEGDALGAMRFGLDDLSQKSQLQNGKLNLSAATRDRYTDPNERKVMEKLEQLNRQLNMPEQAALKSTAYNNNYKPDYNHDAFNTQVDKLESMMEMIGKNEASDPEMDKLENVMDKILDIQHPERIEQKLKEKTIKDKDEILPVSAVFHRQNISLLESADTPKPDTDLISSGFYGSDDEERMDIEKSNAIEAVIHETQTLVNGSTVKLRLLNDVFINERKITAGNFIYGIAALNKERLTITINSLRYGNTIFPIHLDVYDLDGLAGIYIPGSITREVASQSVDNGLQTIGMTSINPTISEQAASAGISAAKSLLSKKVKQVKVTVKAGYKILLKDKKTGQ